MKILFIEGKIASFDENNTYYESIGVDDGKIVFMGSNLEAEKIKGDFDEIHSFNGRMVIPGLNDSHMHLLNYGYDKTKLDLSSFISIEEMIDGAKCFLEENTNNMDWLLGRGWNQDNLIEKRYITRRDLDKISRKTPIIFSRVCGHVSVCNTVALSKVNFSEAGYLETYIDKDSGLFQEEALNILFKAVDSPSIEEIKDMILSACNDLVKMGITSVQTEDLCSMPDQDYKKVISAYKSLREDNKLPVRIYEQCLFFNKYDFEKFIEEGYRTGHGDDFFKIGPLKLLLDGSLGARTAYLKEPYNNNPGLFGIPCFDQKELNEIVELAVENDIQIAAHGIGDKAMEMFIDAIDLAGEKNKSKDLRHGIVHAQITSYQIIDRMAGNSMAAYIQPVFLDYDLHIVEERVGDRYKESYAFKTMMEKGVLVCLGTDAPVVSFNPFENIYCAVTRKDLNGYPKNGFLPHEKLTVEEALVAYTANGAKASFEEKFKGILKIGYLGDFIAIDRNIFSISPEAVKDIEVFMTVINGNIVYKRM